MPDSVNPFVYLEKVAFNQQVVVVPAHIITDEASRAGRRTDRDRYVVHYMQPHMPFLERGSKRKDVRLQRPDLTYRESTYMFDVVAGREPIDRQSISSNET